MLLPSVRPPAGPKMRSKRLRRTSTCHSGGCACGAVRYEFRSTLFDAGWCHCRICQRVSGAPAMAFASVPPDDLVITEGAETVRRCASSEFGRREYCGACGTPLTMTTSRSPRSTTPMRCRPASTSSGQARSPGSRPRTIWPATNDSGRTRAVWRGRSPRLTSGHPGASRAARVGKPRSPPSYPALADGRQDKPSHGFRLQKPPASKIIA